MRDKVLFETTDFVFYASDDDDEYNILSIDWHSPGMEYGHEQPSFIVLDDDLAVYVAVRNLFGASELVDMNSELLMEIINSILANMDD